MCVYILILYTNIIYFNVYILLCSIDVYVTLVEVSRSALCAHVSNVCVQDLVRGPLAAVSYRSTPAWLLHGAGHAVCRVL